jgi:hypothetical protein
VSGRTAVGYPGTELLKRVEAANHDLIVMGSRGREVRSVPPSSARFALRAQPRDGSRADHPGQQQRVRSVRPGGRRLARAGARIDVPLTEERTDVTRETHRFLRHAESFSFAGPTGQASNHSVSRQPSTPKMSRVGIGNWFRRLFSSAAADDEAAEREEYGTPDRGQAELERDRAGSFAETETAQVAEDELEEFEPPRDLAP